MRDKEKYTDILALLILAVVVINWKTFFSVSNIIVIISCLLGIIYVFTTMIKKSVHYGLILNIIIAFEIVPAFLLKNEWYYRLLLLY